MKIQVIKNILDANDSIASEIRGVFADKGAALINLMSSPGAGKTELLDATLGALEGKLRCAVIEGDICTSLDAERLAHRNVPLVQINTETLSSLCHLEASMVREAAKSFDMDNIDIVFIENVGNLVCPAEFDLGADISVALLSSPEGPDKPLKYPQMFKSCEVAIISKIDIAAALGADMDLYENNIRSVNPAARVIRLSARTGEGMSDWIDLLKELSAKKTAAK